MHTVIVGFDSFDPSVFERLLKEEKTPNLVKLADAGGYSPLLVCSPPQTEVSWTSIATGSDPGVHGIFDFVHRDPQTYAPYVSILPTKTSVLGEQFIPPYDAKTLFQEATENGYPASALWWPALFPARMDIPVATIPGLGTPDVRGQLGVGTFFTTELDGHDKKTKIVKLESNGNRKFAAQLEGPQKKTRSGIQPLVKDVSIEILSDTEADISIGDQRLRLVKGEWSPIIELKFPAGFAFSVYAITKVILTETKERVSLYFLPLQIHPLHSVWHYGTPPSFVKKNWKEAGPFLTLGWPQDTTALEEGCISDDQFLDLCESIFKSRERVYMYRLEHHKEGVLAGIFDDLDRIQHMFLRDRQDIVDEWYRRLDEFVGRVQAKMATLGMDKACFLVLSDHGFRPFSHKVNLNRWLVENGYMTLHGQNGAQDFTSVDWEKTRVYALGLNSLYLNVAGREGKGILAPDQIEPLLAEVKEKLSALEGPDGKQVASNVQLKHEVYNGPHLRNAPDFVVGYAPGYRASSDTGLGKIGKTVFETNTDHWGADHCIDPAAVPGVAFANRDLANIPGLSYRDIPFLAIGKHLDQSHIKPPSQSGKGQENIEERLKGLGYL